jgi:hypothetical protein
VPISDWRSKSAIGNWQSAIFLWLSMWRDEWPTQRAATRGTHS